MIEINDKINAALSIYDIEEIKLLGDRYSEQLVQLYNRIPELSNLEHNCTTNILFYFFHELTHVRVAQNQSFLNERKRELENRISVCDPSVRRLMKKSLRRNGDLIEEVICDLEACQRIKDIVISPSEFENSLQDIVHTMNIMNSVNNIRKRYLNKRRGSLFSPMIRLSHSKETNNTIARFIFIQNFWKDDIILTPRVIMNDIMLTARLFALDEDTRQYCRREYEKTEYTFGNSKDVMSILNDICRKEDQIVERIVSNRNNRNT